MKLFKHRTRSGLFQVSACGGNMRVYPQGGGYEKLYTPFEFAEQFSAVESDFPLKKGTVTADFFPEDIVLPCYSTGLLWNGLGQPLFDRKTASRVVELLNSKNLQNGDLPLRWEDNHILCRNKDFDDAELASEDNPQYLKFLPEKHLIDGTERELWSIGDGWTWDAVEFGEPA